MPPSATTSTSGKSRRTKSPGSPRATAPATRTHANRPKDPDSSSAPRSPLKTERPDSDDPIASESGDVYFYSPEQLDPNNPGVLNEKNLYVYRHGAVKYVATLDANTSINRIQISPDGSHVAFLTAARLTSYDNEGWREMYTFNPNTGVIRCASCLPTGEPPTVLRPPEESPRAQFEVPPERKAPSKDVMASQSGRFMADDGRTVFATSDALVESDTDGLLDVYEYVGGRPQLITSGTSQSDLLAGNRFFPGEFIGLEAVSRDGQDIYFSTFDTLAPLEDHNGPFVKFYDARTNGGFASPGAHLPCVAADECHGDENAGPEPAAIATDANLGPAVSSKPKQARSGKSTAGGGGRIAATTAMRDRGDGMAERNIRVAGVLGLAFLVLLFGFVLADRAAATQEITDFEAKVSGTQAGGHPDVDYAVSWTNRQGSNVPCNCEDARILDMHFPTGFIGNPHNVPACSLTEFSLHECSPDSQVGVTEVLGTLRQALYNLVPHADEAGPGRLLHPGSRNTSLHRSARPHRVRLRARRDQLRRLPPAADHQHRSSHLGSSGGPKPRQQSLPPGQNGRGGMQTVSGGLLRLGGLHLPARALPSEPDYLRRTAGVQSLDRVLHRDRRQGVRRLAGDDGLRPAHLQSEPHCDGDHGGGRQRLRPRRGAQGAADAEPDGSLTVRDPRRDDDASRRLFPCAQRGQRQARLRRHGTVVRNGRSSALPRVRQDRHLDASTARRCPARSRAASTSASPCPGRPTAPSSPPTASPRT